MRVMTGVFKGREAMGILLIADGDRGELHRNTDRWSGGRVS